MKIVLSLSVIGWLLISIESLQAASMAYVTNNKADTDTLNTSLIRTLLESQVNVESQVAYFQPTDDTFRDVYSRGGVIFGLEATRVRAWHGFYSWVSARYFGKSGRSSGLGDRTKIDIVPIGAGLNYLFCGSQHYDLFIGAGMLPTYLHITDESNFVIRKSTNWGLGGIVKMRLHFNITRSFFLDLFSDYSFIKISCNNRSSVEVERKPADLSGLTMGAGVGACF